MPWPWPVAVIRAVLAARVQNNIALAWDLGKPGLWASLEATETIMAVKPTHPCVGSALLFLCLCENCAAELVGELIRNLSEELPVEGVCPCLWFRPVFGGDPVWCKMVQKKTQKGLGCYT